MVRYNGETNGSDVIAKTLNGLTRICWSEARELYVRYSDKEPVAVFGRGSDILVEMKYTPDFKHATKVKRPINLKKVAEMWKADAYSHQDEDISSKRTYYSLHFWRIYKSSEQPSTNIESSIEEGVKELSPIADF